MDFTKEELEAITSGLMLLQAAKGVDTKDLFGRFVRYELDRTVGGE